MKVNDGCDNAAIALIITPEPQTAGLVTTQFQTFAEDYFVSGTKAQGEPPSNCTL